MANPMVMGQRFGTRRLGLGQLGSAIHFQQAHRLKRAADDSEYERTLLLVSATTGDQLRLRILLADQEQPPCYEVIRLHRGRPLTAFTSDCLATILTELAALHADSPIDQAVIDDAYRARIAHTHARA